MHQIKIASPLYILRKEAEKNLFAVLEKIKALGFDGVEFLGFFGQSPEAIKRELDRLSLQALGNHISAEDFMADIDGVIANHKLIGCEYITIGIPRELVFQPSGLAETIEKLKLLSLRCYKAGLTPLYHNHGFEYGQNYSIADEILDRCAGEKLCFEPDLGWMAFKGVDPAQKLVKYKDRCPVIHLKDIFARDLSKAVALGDPDDQKASPERGYFEFRPVGYGMVNIPRLMPFCLDCNPNWFVMDHDMAYERSAYDDLKISLKYTRRLINLQ
jgi:sugar phosphate isomerase/epimerase